MEEFALDTSQVNLSWKDKIKGIKDESFVIPPDIDSSAL